jgi:hypothetical protein
MCVALVSPDNNSRVAANAVASSRSCDCKRWPTMTGQPGNVASDVRAKVSTPPSIYAERRR